MKPVVLFVDDEASVLEGFARVLRGSPFEVLTTTSTDRAMQILATTAVQVVVSDERMPGMSGTEFLRGVRRRYPGVVRIALTGESDIARTTRLIEEGELYRFLVKPIGRAELLRTLERAVGVRQVAEEADRIRHAVAEKPLP